MVVAESSCASEGTVDVLLEPQLPAPLLAVLGEGPAARTLAELAGTIGWRVARELRTDADAVVVATMGHGDEDALAEALAGPRGLRRPRRERPPGGDGARRAAAPAASTSRPLARLRSPAGLDLGPSSQQEIAVAILAELVAWRHLASRRARRPSPRPSTRSAG